jgi:hypothetical protein
VRYLIRSCLQGARRQEISGHLFHWLVVVGVDFPRIHPFKVITAIADRSPCAQYCYFVGRTTNDRNAELSGRALLHYSSYVNLAVTVEIAAQIEWIHTKGELVILRKQTIGDSSIDYLRNVMRMYSRMRRRRRTRIRLGYRVRLKINLVRVTALGCYDERTIANTQLINENPLKILLQPWIDAVCKDRQIPELFVSLNIPRFDVSTATIVIRCYIADTVLDNWLNLCRCGTLCSCQTRKKCHGKVHKSESSHRRANHQRVGARLSV